MRLSRPGNGRGNPPAHSTSENHGPGTIPPRPHLPTNAPASSRRLPQQWSKLSPFRSPRDGLANGNSGQSGMSLLSPLSPRCAICQTGESIDTRQGNVPTTLQSYGGRVENQDGLATVVAEISRTSKSNPSSDRDCRWGRAPPNPPEIYFGMLWSR
ncbi:hypothetical protein ACCO45_008439 [Purpureocillium lilacinum]|uniref:Uncharacterized protein n=1 Tax=Purpureocillium lilacinum TaxID=33203 RepID=A0ACC4DNN9_PURLI